MGIFEADYAYSNRYPKKHDVTKRNTGRIPERCKIHFLKEGQLVYEPGCLSVGWFDSRWVDFLNGREVTVIKLLVKAAVQLM